MLERPIRFAIVGAGAIARAYEAAFEQIEHAVIVAVCDVNADAAAAAARRLDCSAYLSLETLIRFSEFDAAVVCTPPASHEAIATALSHAKKHVLCEKPLSIGVDAARRMLDAAAVNDTILTMASKFRYAADVRKARELLRGGAIGELVAVETAFTTHVDMAQRWNSNAAVSGGGVLIDNGTHALDILRYFLGNLRDLQAVEGRRIQQLAVEDTVRVFVQNDAGVMGAADLSWSIDKEMETYIRIYGSEGTILVGWRESKFRRRREPAWETFGQGYNKIQAFRDQIDNFCSAIDGTADLVITGRDALASVEAVQTAYAALEKERWERIGSRLDELDIQPLRETHAIGAA